MADKDKLNQDKQAQVPDKTRYPHHGPRISDRQPRHGEDAGSHAPSPGKRGKEK